MTKASKGSWVAGLLDQSFRQKYQGKAGGVGGKPNQKNSKHILRAT